MRPGRFLFQGDVVAASEVAEQVSVTVDAQGVDSARPPPCLISQLEFRVVDADTLTDITFSVLRFNTQEILYSNQYSISADGTVVLHPALDWYPLDETDYPVLEITCNTGGTANVYPRVYLKDF